MTTQEKKPEQISISLDMKAIEKMGRIYAAQLLESVGAPEPGALTNPVNQQAMLESAMAYGFASASILAMLDVLSKGANRDVAMGAYREAFDMGWDDVQGAGEMSEHQPKEGDIVCQCGCLRSQEQLRDAAKPWYFFIPRPGFPLAIFDPKTMEPIGEGDFILVCGDCLAGHEERPEEALKSHFTWKGDTPVVRAPREGQSRPVAGAARRKKKKKKKR